MSRPYSNHVTVNGLLDFNLDNVGMTRYSQEVSRSVDICCVFLRVIGRNGTGMFFLLDVPI